MRQFFRNIAGMLDALISGLFLLGISGTGSPARRRWTFYGDWGRRIGIVGTDGKVHTVMGYHAVHHYLEGGKLIRRVPVRKDLKPGERLATEKELLEWQRSLQHQLSEAQGFEF